MNNPLVNNMQSQMNPAKLLQQLRSDPMKFMKNAGFNVPDNLNNPNDIIQHLMNTGQISQQKYNQVVRMVQQFKM